MQATLLWSTLIPHSCELENNLENNLSLAFELTRERESWKAWNFITKKCVTLFLSELVVNHHISFAFIKQPHIDALEECCNADILQKRF